MDPAQWATIIQQVGGVAAGFIVLGGVVAWLGRRYIASLETNASEWRSDSKTNTDSLRKIQENSEVMAKSVDGIHGCMNKMQALLERQGDHLGDVRGNLGNVCKFEK